MGEWANGKLSHSPTLPFWREKGGVWRGIVLSIVVGLTSDFGESILIDIGYDNGRHTAPTFHGDTLYAESEVLRSVRATDMMLVLSNSGW